MGGAGPSGAWEMRPRQREAPRPTCGATPHSTSVDFRVGPRTKMTLAVLFSGPARLSVPALPRGGARSIVCPPVATPRDDVPAVVDRPRIDLNLRVPYGHVVGAADVN